MRFGLGAEAVGRTARQWCRRLSIENFLMQIPQRVTLELSFQDDMGTPGTILGLLALFP